VARINKIMVFLGAGASRPFGIPTMTEMAEEFEQKLHHDDSPHLEFFNRVKSRLQDYQCFDIEAFITVFQGICGFDDVSSRALAHPSVHYFLAERCGGIADTLKYEKGLAKRDCTVAEQLLGQLKGFIADSCDIKKQSFDIYTEFFSQVMHEYYNLRGALEGQSPKKSVNCEIFTTNYDRVTEAYCHRMGLEYECGEDSGQLLKIDYSNDILFNHNTYAFKIYKLHGSINWYQNESGRLCWLTEPARIGKLTSLGDHITNELLIYPAFEKYTFREPFYALFHYLKSRLVECEKCYVVGYSFRDEDILSLFLDSMQLNSKLRIYLIDPNAEVIVKEKFSKFSRRVRQIPVELSMDIGKQVCVS